MIHARNGRASFGGVQQRRAGANYAREKAESRLCGCVRLLDGSRGFVDERSPTMAGHGKVIPRAVQCRAATARSSSSDGVCGPKVKRRAESDSSREKPIAVST